MEVWIGIYHMQSQKLDMIPCVESLCILAIVDGLEIAEFGSTSV